MTYTTVKSQQNDPLHSYFVLSATNQDQTGQSQYPLVFNANRSQVYLSRPRDYLMSVIRLDVLTPWSLPVMIPQIQTGQNNINQTIYQIGFINLMSMAVFTGPIIYTSQLTNYNTAVVASPFTAQANDPYYYIYTYEWFIQLLLSVLNPLLVANGWNNIRIRIDPSTMNIQILNPSSNSIAIIMNPPLFNLFSTFNFLMVDAVTYPSYNGWFQLDLQTYQANGFETDASVPYYMFSTLNSPLAIWNPIQSIVFSTSMIPIASTLVPPVSIYNNFGLSNQNSNTNATPILTDIVVPFGDANSSYKPFFQFLPKSEFIMVDIVADAPLSEIRIEVLWKDNVGNLHPLYLSAGNSADIKLLFRQKRFDISN